MNLAVDANNSRWVDHDRAVTALTVGVQLGESTNDYDLALVCEGRPLCSRWSRDRFAGGIGLCVRLKAVATDA